MQRPKLVNKHYALFATPVPAIAEAIPASRARQLIDERCEPRPAELADPIKF